MIRKQNNQKLRSFSRAPKELLLALTLDQTLAKLQPFDARFRPQKNGVYTFAARHPVLRWIQFTGTAQGVDGRYTLIRYGGTNLPLAFSTLGLLYLALLTGVFMIFRGGIGELLTVLTITGGIVVVSVALQMIQQLAGDSMQRLFHDDRVIEPQLKQ